MKVAFATQDLERVDAHFGWAKWLSIYEIDRNGHHLVENVSFQGDLEEDGNEDKLAPKLAALMDCAIVYVAAIGGSAAARIIAHKIHPVKVPQPEPIAEILARLQQVLEGTPPPWLRKALGKGKAPDARFEDREEGEIRG